MDDPQISNASYLSWVRGLKIYNKCVFFCEMIVPFVDTGIKAAILGFLNKKIQIVPFTGTGIKKRRKKR